MVEIIHYEVANKNKTIGYVDIRIPILQPTVLIFKKIAHVQSGDRKWFNFPSFQKEDKYGQKVYNKFFQFEKEAYNKELLDCLAPKVQEYCEKNNISHGEKISFDTFPQEDPFELPF